MIKFTATILKFNEQGEKTGWTYIEIPADIAQQIKPNNKTCAISCTGHGEMFIRAVAAYDVSCLMEYKGFSLEKAMNKVVMKKLVKIDGEGGMIGVDSKGNASLIFNSKGMYRGMKSSNGKAAVEIYR